MFSIPYIQRSSHLNACVMEWFVVHLNCLGAPLAHSRLVWNRVLMIVIFSRVIPIIIVWVSLAIFVIYNWAFDLLHWCLFSNDTSLRSEFIMLRSSGPSSCGIHQYTFIFKTSVINTIDNSSFGHYWASAANNVCRSSPCLLDRFISTFHDIHDWIEKFLIFNIYMPLSDFLSFVSNCFDMRKLPRRWLIYRFFHPDDIVN